MTSHAIDTDYLIIGAGASGLAFTDTLIAQDPDAHVTLVDRHGMPGGHWNDAYPFVTLHQPSAFYGVDSMPLGSGRKDTHGPNCGMYELATGAEVNRYFQGVMHERLIPSGRVRYHPLCNHLGDGHFESLLSGAHTRVTVRKKIVDAAYYGPTVPATHVRNFDVAPGVRVVPPGALPGLWQQLEGRPAPRRFVVLGGGKTAMDTCLWLMQSGAGADAICWVVPRDSWVINRVTTQNAPEFFDQAIGGQADQMEAFAHATSADDLFLRLERSGVMLRIDPNVMPTMHHYATVAAGEVEALRAIRDVVRLGRVRMLAADHVELERGRIDMPASEALYIDCTASAIVVRDPVPVFQERRIVLQMLRMPQPAFSAALAAFVEAHYDDDARKNQLCVAVPFPYSLDGYARAVMGNIRNQMAWSHEQPLREWIRASRLDGFGKLMASASRDDAHKQAIIARLKEQSAAAMANMPKLLAAAPA